MSDSPEVIVRKRSVSSSNSDLIGNINKTLGHKLDPRVMNAMLSVDRANYCQASYPLKDRPESIGYGQTISAPHMHAYALDMLKDQLVEGAKALDVGSGSGYLTACMAHMVGRTGSVVGVEHFPELVELAINNLQHDQPELLESERVKILLGDGRQGHEKDAPYNAIHVGAAAKQIPQPLIDQLKPGGRMVIPVGGSWYQQLFQVDKLANGKIVKKSITDVAFVPLTDVEY
ncbi:Protein-L-isoaspartate(D-aspartate) O-methyltransferase [Halotydeus destructor]|nr:Protein-L-isoaspartate(D-aspartate) O-methyltransferase [Halotydeus destructor]